MRKIITLFAASFSLYSIAQEQKPLTADEILAVQVEPGTKGFSLVDSKCEKMGEGTLTGGYYKDNVYMLEDYMLCNNGGGPQFFYKVFTGDYSAYIPVASVKVITKGKTDDDAKILFSQMRKERKEFLSIELRNNKTNPDALKKIKNSTGMAVQANCLLKIIPKNSTTMLFENFNESSNIPKWDFLERKYYYSKKPLCAAKIYFDKNSKPQYYKVNFGESAKYFSADDFTLVDAAETLRKYKDDSNSLIYQDEAAKDQNNLDLKELRKDYLIKKYGLKTGNKILTGEIWVGMSKAMLIDSLGEPEHINLSESTRSYLSQYIYRNTIYGTVYVYITNDKVVSIDYV